MFKWYLKENTTIAINNSLAYIINSTPRNKPTKSYKWGMVTNVRPYSHTQKVLFEWPNLLKSSYITWNRSMWQWVSYMSTSWSINGILSKLIGPWGVRILYFNLVIMKQTKGNGRRYLRIFLGDCWLVTNLISITRSENGSLYKNYYLIFAIVSLVDLPFHK